MEENESIASIWVNIDRFEVVERIRSRRPWYEDVRSFAIQRERGDVLLVVVSKGEP